MTYVDTTLEWDEATSRWTTSAPLLELSKQSTQWGDRSGGEKMVSTAAMAAGGGEEAGPGSGSTCLHGTWRTDTCNGAKTHTLSFTTANNGHYVMPDCNNVCTKPLDYHYDYSIAGSNVTLRHTGSSEILCNGSPATPPKPTSNDTFAFSCDTLTTTTSLGTKTFTRVK